jgi:hypothetical protein
VDLPQDLVGVLGHAEVRPEYPSDGGRRQGTGRDKLTGRLGKMLKTLVIRSDLAHEWPGGGAWPLYGSAKRLLTCESRATVIETARARNGHGVRPSGLAGVNYVTDFRLPRGLLPKPVRRASRAED